MKQARKTEINLVIKNLLDNYKITKTPYKYLKDICIKENIRLLSVEKLSEKVDGFIQNIKEKIYIFYNPNKLETRQNFTIAHELGHYFLNHLFQENRMVLCDNELDLFDNTTNIEVEANYFASHILLPQNLIIKDFYDIINYNKSISYPKIPLKITNYGVYYRNWKIITNKLCKKYKVSEEMLSYRLQGLGLINSNLFSK